MTLSDIEHLIGYQEVRLLHCGIVMINASFSPYGILNASSCHYVCIVTVRAARDQRSSLG
jgi:hypothetical protein